MVTGKKRFKLGGKDYQLVLDINAMADFEGATGRDAIDALDDLQNGRMRVADMRAMFWALFQAHHPEISLRDAGTLLAENPKALGETVRAAMPKTEDAPGNQTAAVTQD